MTVYLGVDYGEKHIGVALADGPLAQPLTSIDGDPEKSYAILRRLIADNQVDKIVIGLPGGVLDNKIKKYGTTLERQTSIPVVYHEETLSTQEALERLRASNASKKKLMNDHVYAACLILEDYLETGDVVN